MVSRYFLSALLSIVCCCSLWAVPAKRVPHTFAQSDGLAITLFLVGDEHFHTFITTDGLTVGRNEAGDFCYLTPDSLTSVMAHDPAARTAQEAAFVESHTLSVEALVASQREKIDARRATMLKAHGKREAEVSDSDVPHSGAPKIPVILVSYTDVSFSTSDPKATFQDYFASKTGKSAYSYFYAQSGGKFAPQFDLYGPVTLSHNQAYYGSNFNQHVGEMIAEGCIALSSQIDFSQYDNNGDGYVDTVIFLYAGDGQATSGNTNAVWPCQSYLSQSDYGKTLTCNGVQINKFGCFNELQRTSKTQIEGVGVVCHEFSHCLGLPDFYDNNYKRFGMGHWSVLDYGCYGDDGYTPIGYSGFEKAYLGWIDLEEAAENTQYTLPVFNSGNDRAVKVTNSQDPNEYYVIENRAQQGWDKYLVTSGLFIYHVTYDKNAWANNCVNDYDLQRMTPIPADNSLKLKYVEPYYVADKDDELGDLWPCNGNNALTDSSTPAATVNTGSLMGKPITEITKNSDGTISFWAMKGATSVTDISATAADAAPTYYNLQGQKLAGAVTTPGLYIVKRGQQATKELIK